MPGLSLRWFLALAVAGLALLVLAGPAGADETNFNESGACGVAGYRPPLAGRSGSLPTSQPVYGPWADVFGRNYSQVGGQMVRWTVPMSSGATVLVSRAALPAFQQVTANLAAAAQQGLYYPVSVASGWSWRSIVGGSMRMSFHAFGTAVDINPRSNPYSDDPDAVLVTDMPEWYRRAWQDAGFCWGGDWVSKKDAMHFSWMGPAATPGYAGLPAPAAPLTSRSPFDRAGLTGRLGLDSSYPWTFALADRSRDGAPDVYGLRVTGDGKVRMEIAGAASGFAVVGARLDLDLPGVTESGFDLLLGDYDRDAWVDLWTVERATGRVTVYTDATGFEPRVAFDIPVVAGAALLLGDYNRDGVDDVYVLDPAGTLSIYDVSDAVPVMLAEAATGIDPGAVHTGLGDLDVDGIPDLYIVASSVQVLTGATAYAGPLEIPGPARSAGPADRVLFGDYDGDGRTDLYIVGPDLATAVWLGGTRNLSDNLQVWFVHPDDDPWDAGPECVGPGACDRIGYARDTGEFVLKDGLGSDGGRESFYYGIPGDQALMGDWDCDGEATPGMYRPTTGYVYLSNTDGTRPADLEFFFGLGSDIPLAGDWNGDGCDTISVYRPGEGRVFIRNSLATGTADYAYYYGAPGDRPFAGDFDGDGIDTVGLYRPTTGFVYFRNTNSQGIAEREFFYGEPGDIITAGDWDGNGTDTLATYRPAEGRWYFRLDNSQGFADHVIAFGPSSVVLMPVAGAFGPAG